MCEYGCIAIYIVRITLENGNYRRMMLRHARNVHDARIVGGSVRKCNDARCDGCASERHGRLTISAAASYVFYTATKCNSRDGYFIFYISPIRHAVSKRWHRGSYNDSTLVAFPPFSCLLYAAPRPLSLALYLGITAAFPSSHGILAVPAVKNALLTQRESHKVSVPSLIGRDQTF